MDLDAALRAQGHRVTRSRRVIWDVLSASGGHLNAHEITERVHQVDPRVNASSIYRTLALLTELELVRESRLGDDASTWEPAHGDSVIHLVCTRCGQVQHHHARVIDRLGRSLADEAGFAAESVDVRVTGVCDRCAAVVAPGRVARRGA